MNRPLALAAFLEALTGMALLIAPALVGRLLLGAELSGIAEVIARTFGIGLLSLGIACWPRKMPTGAAVAGMLTYGALVTMYLAYLGIRGEWVGPLLWPAVVLHGVLSLLLAHQKLTRRDSLLAAKNARL